MVNLEIANDGDHHKTYSKTALKPPIDKQVGASS